MLLRKSHVNNITTADSASYLPHVLERTASSPAAAWSEGWPRLWVVGLCGMQGWKKGMGFVETFLNNHVIQLFSPMCGEAVRAGRLTPGSWWNGLQALLFDVRKQVPSVASILSVCLCEWYNADHLSCGVVYLRNVNEGFLWRHNPNLWNSLFVRIKVCLQFSFRRCFSEPCYCHSLLFFLSVSHSHSQKSMRL